MKQIIICGDSFMSPVTTFPGTHFAEIFAKELDFDLLCFSRAGMSNGGIAIQIESAIERKPDLILFNTTSFDRIEIPITSDINSEPKFNWMEGVLPYRVENMLYTQSVGVSSNYEWSNKDPKIWSISLQNLLQHRKFDGNNDGYWNHNSMSNLEHIKYYQERMDAAKKYFMYLYDENMKMLTDNHMMYAVLHKLHLSNIPYIWVHSFLKGFMPNSTPWMDQKNHLCYTINQLISKSLSTPFKDPGYHTSFETQEKIAQIIIEHYKNNFV